MNSVRGIGFCSWLLEHQIACKHVLCMLQQVLVVLQVVAEFETFKEDQRPGRLMMVCLTPYVNKDMAMTSFAMAHRVLDSHCPDAICLVVHGRGVNAILKDPRHPEWARDQGTIVYDRADAERYNRGRQGQCQATARRTWIWHLIVTFVPAAAVHYAHGNRACN